MKRIYTMIAICIFSMASAQVPNPGFEQTLADGFTLKNWGAFFPLAISIDENGNNTGDQIVFQNGSGFSSPVGNCVTGSWSMMVTNAFNMTTNKVIAGKASLFNDAESETAMGWNNGYPIAPGADVSILGFDYSFFPAGNDDVAEAVMELFGASGERVGRAEIVLSEFQSDFAYVYAPVAFTSSEAPVFMTIDFNMAKEGSTPTFGSMLLVDNVKVNFLPLANAGNSRNLFTIFPTVADSEINIIKGDNSANTHFDILVTDITGKTVRNLSMELLDAPATIDVSGLNAGIYFVRASGGNASEVTKFIKK